MSKSNSEPTRPDYPVLTMFRGILALIVVFYHFQRNLVNVQFPLLGIIERGYVAVSAFFILSGFILSKVYLSRCVSVTEFYKARFARVYPVYFLGILAMAPILVYSAYVSERKLYDLVPNFFLTISCVQSWSAETWRMWNLVGWSISCEAFFYALFPLVLLLARKAESHLYFILVILAAMAGLGHEPSQYGYGEVLPWLHEHSPIIRLPEFCLGVATAFLPAPSFSRYYVYLLVALFSALMAGMLEFPAGSISAILVPVTWAALIWLLSSSVFKVGMKPFIWLGQISFSLYIFHIIAALYIKPLAVRMVGDYAFILQITFALAVAHCVHKYFEVPMRARLLAFSAQKRPS